MINSSRVLNKKYQITEKIGNGKFGTVFKAINLKTNETLAIKTQPRDISIKLLKNEATILKYLYDHGSRTTPIVYWYGSDFYNVYLVMSFYDISLFDYLHANNVTVEKIDKIIHVCIDILETIHKLYIIHRDIKPQNFMIHNEEIYLIDFGLSSFFIDDNGEHLPNLGSPTITGTPKYVSHNIHSGSDPTRRDDLISIGYLYIFLLKRELPWESNYLITDSNYKETFDENHIMHFKNKQRSQLKSWENIEKMSSLFNEKIYRFLNYCYSLNHDSLPDYEGLKLLFTNTPINNNL